MNTIISPGLQAVLAIVLLAQVSVFARQVEARWALEATEASIGQSLTLNLEVRGSDRVEPPALTVPNVQVFFLGGAPSNSTSIVSVNGRVTQTESKSWSGSWSLKSMKEGNYHINGVELKVGGKIIRLPALDWKVIAAMRDPRFELQQKLNPESCIPGLDVEYSLTWYIGQSVQNPEFTLPILDDPDIVPVEGSFSSASGNTFQVQYKGRTLTGEKTIEQRNGEQVTALTIKFRVKPSKPGRFDLSGTMVSFEGAVDTRQARDFFGQLVTEPVYRALLAQAQPLVFLVKDLPSEGKPSPFSGLVGKLQLAWESVPAASLGFSVGEPIRLTLRLEGALNKPGLDLDYMVTAGLNNSDFQVSADSTAKEEAGRRGFVLRARRPGRLVVPSLSLNYFDPSANRYGFVSTKPLAFDISGSKAAAPGLSSTASTALQNGSTIGSQLEAASGTASPDAILNTQAMMNSNGLEPRTIPSLPWWVFALPGSVAGAFVALAGLWKHSARRKLVAERKAWLLGLSPLAAVEGRGALEEGRYRLHRLLQAGENWRAKLMKTGRWVYLENQVRDWDEAFFADSRDSEAWGSRWENMRDTMEPWK